MAVQTAHNWLIDVEQRVDDALCNLCLMIEQRGRRRVAGNVIEITPGGKGAACAGDDHDVRPSIIARKLQRLGQFIVQRQIDRIHGIGAIECQGQQPAAP